MTQPTIIGAGLAGLIAAHSFTGSRILEAAPAPAQLHKALLRFRSDAVSKATGIDFRRVRVHKGIFAGGQFFQPDIRLANMYAQKVLGRLAGDRSIWNIDAVDRFIAPDTFYEQMLETVGSRVEWGAAADFAGWSRQTPTISTAPLPVALKGFGIDHDLAFERSPISVLRATVKGADVFQTVYFPDPNLSVYRASITGNTLIVEAMIERGQLTSQDVHAVLTAFNLPMSAMNDSTTVEQKYGKIAPVDDAARKQLLFRLTHEFNVFSLGRFATWRNILLDDVVSDISAIKKLMRGNAYERNAAAVSGDN